jgi:hypothetical protein
MQATAASVARRASKTQRNGEMRGGVNDVLIFVDSVGAKMGCPFNGFIG